jgi:hypothetical protein
MLTAVVARLRALSPVGLALVALAAFAAVGGSTAVARSLITGADIQDRSVEGRDIAESTVTHANIRNDSVLSQDIRDGHVLSRDIRDGTIKTTDLSADVRSRLSGGAKGGDGAPGAAGKDGATGATGATGVAGAPGGFMVQDANGTTAGPLLTFTQDIGTPTITFFFNGHSFSADAITGALALPAPGFYYDQPGCTGNRYYGAYFPLQTAVRSADTSDPNIYEFAADAPSTVAFSSVWQSGCNTTPFSASAIPLTVLPAGDTPPTLTGPLSYAPAG